MRLAESQVNICYCVSVNSKPSEWTLRWCYLTILQSNRVLSSKQPSQYGRKPTADNGRSVAYMIAPYCLWQSGPQTNQSNDPKIVWVCQVWICREDSGHVLRITKYSRLICTLPPSFSGTLPSTVSLKLSGRMNQRPATMHSQHRPRPLHVRYFTKKTTNFFSQSLLTSLLQLTQHLFNLCRIYALLTHSLSLSYFL